MDDPRLLLHQVACSGHAEHAPETPRESRNASATSSANGITLSTKQLFVSDPLLQAQIRRHFPLGCSPRRTRWCQQIRPVVTGRASSVNLHVNAAVWWPNRWHHRICLDEHPSERCRQIWRAGNGWRGNQPLVLLLQLFNWEQSCSIQYKQLQYTV